MNATRELTRAGIVGVAGPTLALRLRDNPRPSAHGQLREVAVAENGVRGANLPDRLLHVNARKCT